MRSRLGRLRQLVLGSIALSLIGATLVIQQWSASSRHILTHPYFNYTLEPEETDQTCKLPRIHPFDQSIWKYFPPPKTITCKSRQPDTLLKFDGTGWIRIDPEVASNYPGLSCTYRSVIRPEGDDFHVTYSNPVPIPPAGIQVFEDFVLAKCSRKVFAIESTVYEGFLVQARDVTPPAQIASEKPLLNPCPAKAKRYNILLFGVDSLSRLAFIRLLPRTYQYLTQNLNAKVFRGMNKVADNTFPNLIALLAGEEVYGGRLPVPPAVPHYDGWPFIWKNFSSQCYSTLFAEDLPEFNMFTYLSTGFKDPPSPHYIRPFWLAVQDSAALRASSHLCLGERPRHVIQMDYVKDFVRRRKSFFAFSFLAEISHDYLSRTSAADADFESFLAELNDSGELNDTVLIFFSDHGHRFDPIRETPVGRVEERMPFFSMVLPPDLRSKLPDENLGRLVTPYDVHATLLDLILNQEHLEDLGKVRTRFGTSLFGPVLANRTCEEAGIPSHYCVCSTFKDEYHAETMDPDSERAAGQSVVDVVNALVPTQCMKLTLSIVMSSTKHLTDSWVIVLKAEPSGALFEAVVKQLPDSGRFQVQGEVSRINKYKGQAECVNDAVLRKYCYCR